MIEWLMRTFRRTPPPLPPLPADQREAEKELELAKFHLRRSEQEADEAHRVADDLTRINKENHFAERALMALRGIVE